MMRFASFFVGALCMVSCGQADQREAVEYVAPGECSLLDVECSELQNLPEDAAAYALVYTFGFVGGQQNDAVQDPSRIQRSVLEARDICDKNPKLNLIGAMRLAYKD